MYPRTTQGWKDGGFRSENRFVDRVRMWRNSRRATRKKNWADDFTANVAGVAGPSGKTASIRTTKTLTGTHGS